MLLPITLIYLHRVRHIPLGTTGLLLGLAGLVGLATLPLVGSLSDRLGPGRVLPVIAIGMATSELAMAWAHSATTALLPVCLAGITQGGGFTVFSALLGEMCPEHELQQRAFAVNFAVLNGSIGVGSLVSAAVVDVAHPGSFQSLYLGAATADVAFALALMVGVGGRRPPAAAHKDAAAQPGYQLLLRRPGVALVVGVSLLLALSGYAAVDSGLPGYANVVAHVSPRVIALSITVNTAVIVTLQMRVLRLMRGRRLSRCLAMVGLVWAACWLLLGLSRLPSGLGTRSAMVLAFSALFGVGETFMQPTLAPLVNRLAGEELLGRANALSGGTFSLAFVVSPALSAGLIANGLGWLWIGALVAISLSVVGLSVVLGRRIGPVRDLGGEEPLLLEPVLTAT